MSRNYNELMKLLDKAVDEMEVQLPEFTPNYPEPCGWCVEDGATSCDRCPECGQHGCWQRTYELDTVNTIVRMCVICGLKQEERIDG